MLNSVLFVTVYVTDQDRALKFYEEGLGLEKRIDVEGQDGRFLTVGIPDSPVDILLWSDPASAGAPAQRGAGAGPVPGPLILGSADLRKDVEVFRERGVTFDEPEVQEYPFGLRIEAVDPDGNRISLREQRRP
ncbi:VOC family protein [Labedaea rhizosphaerae]|jgi:catechol 2,3-dioxygenase-like lactoylglutathione lyase family enzyme|uniref:Putative enzyme related to lactoylglutathione lyase n=1 Tax=Labedaea rhizosphaerae TaxID=598644 RepID=A0A4R6SFM0_LABRH|nr:VOC family protein [Labedaea rhizosphaerae]TDQ00812.1 putative enzyme related to lactoylglutathione lyase [Labedaea rhizosphaerae]